MQHAATFQYCLGITANQQPVLTHWYMLQLASIVWGARLTNNHSLLIATCCNLSVLSGEHGKPTTTPYSLKPAATFQYFLESTTNQQPLLTHWNLLQLFSMFWGARLTNNHSLLIYTCLGSTTYQKPVFTHWYMSQVVSSVWGARLPNNHSLLIETYCNFSVLSGEHDYPTTSPDSLLHVATCQYCPGSTTN